MANEARQVAVTPKRCKQGLGAVGAGPHGHPCPVNDGCHVMGMGAVHVEGKDGALVLARPKMRSELISDRRWVA